VGQSIGEHLNPTVLFDYPTLETLAGHVVRDVLHMECEEEAPKAGPEDALSEVRQQAMNEVESMSEEEMNALVNEQLEKLGQ
jgi:hypothetical protein